MSSKSKSHVEPVVDVSEADTKPGFEQPKAFASEAPDYDAAPPDPLSPKDVLRMKLAAILVDCRASGARRQVSDHIEEAIAQLDMV